VNHETKHERNKKEEIIFHTMRLHPLSIGHRRDQEPNQRQCPIRSRLVPSPLTTSSSSSASLSPTPSVFEPALNILTESAWDTVKWDMSRIMSNLKLVVFLNLYSIERIMARLCVTSFSGNVSLSLFVYVCLSKKSLVWVCLNPRESAHITH
jgi:hypothetical protein